MSATQNTTDRLARAYRIEVGPAARERHLHDITAAVQNARSPAPRRGVTRRLVVVVALLAAGLLPLGAAFASQNALPGEPLYRVKLAVDEVRGLFDEDVAATHRVEELEALIDANRAQQMIAEAEQRAAAAVDDLDEPGDLGLRFEEAQARIRVADVEGAGARRPDPDAPSREPATGAGEPTPVVPPAGETPSDRPGAGSAPGGKSSPGSGGDGHRQGAPARP